MKKFLVIGSNSFTGSCLISNLLNKSYDVLGVSRSHEYENYFLPYKFDNNKKQNFQFCKIDLNNDIEYLIKKIKLWKPNFIINFAAQSMVAESWENPSHWYETNVLSQVKLHDKIRHFDFIDKYIHVTTPEVYGNTEGWVKENQNFFPSTPYATSRASCDMHLINFYKAYKFPVIFTRASNVYGPGQQLYRIIPKSIMMAKLGKKLDLHGGGKSVRSFIYGEDVANATLEIALNGTIGSTYHISTNETISIKSLVSKIAEKFNLKLEDIANVGQERLGKDKAYFLDSSRIRKELNWKDKISIDIGLEKTIIWIERYLKNFKNLSLEYEHKK